MEDFSNHLSLITRSLVIPKLKETNKSDSIALDRARQILAILNEAS